MKARILGAIGSAMVLAAVGSPVHAEDDLEKNDHKFFFFHKLDVAEEVFVADREFCASYASRVKPPKGPNVYTPGLAGAAVGGLLGGIQKSSMRRQMARAVLRKCMGMKGYARYALTKDQMEELWSTRWDEGKSRVAARAAKPISDERKIAQ